MFTPWPSAICTCWPGAMTVVVPSGMVASPTGLFQHHPEGSAATA